MECPGQLILDDERGKTTHSLIIDSFKAYFQSVIPKLTTHTRSANFMTRFVTSMSMFPGAQLVSMCKSHLPKIKMGHYLCTEKTDGVRYIFIQLSDGVTYLLNRKSNLYKIKTDSLPFTTSDTKSQIVHIMDGELINENKGLKFLIYDGIVVNSVCIADHTYLQRLKKLQTYVYRKIRNNAQDDQYIPLVLKDIYPTSSIPLILQKIIPLLPHENDGIVFTLNECPYYPGMCSDIIKWKPTSKNTIDFIVSGSIQCKFSENIYQLNCNKGSKHIPFGLLFMKDKDENDKFIEKWKYIKNIGLSYPVVECRYEVNYETDELLVSNYIEKSKLNIEYKNLTVQQKNELLEKAKPRTSYQGGWRIIKYRFDKTTANDYNVSLNVLKSINDNITEAELISTCDKVKFVEEAHIESNAEKEEIDKNDFHTKMYDEDQIDDYENSNDELVDREKEDDLFGLMKISKRKKYE